MSEESLPRSDQTAQSWALGLPRELELGRVVHDQHVRMAGRTACGLPHVRSQDALGRDAVIAEEAVRGLQFGIIKRLGKALAWAVSEPIGQPAQPAIQSLIAQLRVAQLRGDRTDTLGAHAVHARIGSQPGSQRKMCRIMRAKASASVYACASYAFVKQKSLKTFAERAKSPSSRVAVQVSASNRDSSVASRRATRTLIATTHRLTLHADAR